MPELLELAGRAEALELEHVDRHTLGYLFRDIAMELWGGPRPRDYNAEVERVHVWQRFFGFVQAEAWTDAAMTLVPEGFFACVLNAGGAQSSAPTQGRGTAICTPWGDIVRGDPVEAATPALALCAAALRARAA